DCVYDLPVSKENSLLFLETTHASDVSAEYPDHDGLTIRLFKNKEILNDFQTTEFFGSILLSNPLVVNTLDYPYGRYVYSPHAKFDGEKFIILDVDVTNKPPFLES
ncbi:MAG: hypothetical protein WCI60_03990, partial [bacterium]